MDAALHFLRDGQLTLRLTAPWVLPIGAPPIANGAVLLDAHGRIAAVGPDAAVPRGPDIGEQHLEGAALLPGFVNAHTHLELTGFAGMNEADDFWQWIKQIIALKATRTEEQFFDAAQAGIRNCWAAGITSFCDMGNTGSVIAAMDHLGASGVAHHEAFDMHMGELPVVMKKFSAELDRLARHATGRVSIGISPHAPYTVSGPLYRATAELARAHGVPIAVHIAEPVDETKLLHDFTGIFADFLASRGVERMHPESISPVAWLEQHDVLSPRTICAHAIHTDLADADILKHHNAAIAHCPRSNRRHHHADAPTPVYIDRGLRIGLGTDSEVSVAPLDLLAEARAARALAGWSAAEALRALTLGGAEALEREAEAGSLVAGKWADLAAIRVGETEHPEEAILASGIPDVQATWLGGRLVHKGS